MRPLNHIPKSAMLFGLLFLLFFIQAPMASASEPSTPSTSSADAICDVFPSWPGCGITKCRRWKTCGPCTGKSCKDWDEDRDGGTNAITIGEKRTAPPNNVVTPSMQGRTGTKPGSGRLRRDVQRQAPAAAAESETGLPKNCRAIVQANVDSYRAKEYTADEVMNSLERNCGANGHSNQNIEKDDKELSNLKSEISPTELNINTVIKESYKVWYVKKGNKPDFSKYDDYYTSTAVFQDIKEDSIIVSPLSENVKEFKGAFEADHLSSFDEREIGSETIYFGNVAHRISYHIYHTNTSDSITKRGVNSIQLVKINGKWKIQSILRQVESDTYQLPKKYDSYK